MIRQSEDVTLYSILQSDSVFFLKGSPSREEVVGFLSDGLHPQVKKAVTSKVLCAKIREVEALNNVLETGFFIPHAKLDEIDRFYAALALIPEGFTDPKSGATVKAALLLLTPHKPLFFQRHLNMLSKLSRLFQPAFIDSIAALKDGRAVCEAIKKAE
ncbi:MAG: hypothetical protein A3J79_00890 [Elusimicrobia bacterium RIFOXYB2_FULL_62_6]|nr:MAG: hypothetical protein A3J79_00890 [Elusimicrobia bacterium RIFOXYB2_FULL_62_6]